MLARALRRILLIELILHLVLGWRLARYARWYSIEAAGDGGAALTGCLTDRRAALSLSGFHS